MKKFLVFIFCISTLFADEEIHVALSTEAALVPLYLSPVFMEKDSEGASYFEKLRSALSFDLENSGYIYLTQKDGAKDDLLSNGDLKKAFDPLLWKDKKVRFAIKLTANGKQLNLFILDLLYPEKKYSKSLSLAADLDKDRRKIHKFSDEFLSEFVGKKGVAQSSIIYTIRRENPDRNGIPWLSEVWGCDYDGENKRQLTFENSYCVTPVSLPTYNNSGLFNFLYVSYKKGIPKIYINFENKSEPFVQLRGNQLLPALSLNYDQMAFISDAAGRPDLFLQKLDSKRKPLGMPRQLFSAPRATEASPTFSPDGKKLAFVSDKDGTPRIYIIKIPQEGEDDMPYAELITTKNKNNVTPAWSKDGNKLAYCANSSGPRELWIYDFETNEERQLTFSKENKENPCWSDDNLHIVYNTEDRNISELYIINLNNPKPVKISSGLGQKRFPAWVR